MIFIKNYRSDTLSHFCWKRNPFSVAAVWVKCGGSTVKRAQNAQNRLEHGLAPNILPRSLNWHRIFARLDGGPAAYLALELHGPALSDLEHALSLDPQNFEALTGLGVILEQIGAPELALRAYDEVLAIHPHLEQVIKARSRVAEKSLGYHFSLGH